MSPVSPPESLKLAIDHVGSQSAMARLLGVTQAAVWKWVAKGKHLPDIHVLKVEGATGISRHDLRPDLYPRDPAAGEIVPVAPTGMEHAR